jgi:hypothetical protein
MWCHVTNHLITYNDKDSNSENRIKLRVRDTPHWQGSPITSGKDASTVFIVYINEGNLITQRATNEGVYMFSAQVTFIHCGDSPTLIQCSRCHMLSHYTTSSRCADLINTIKCFRCGGPHDGCQHDYECPQKHAIPGKCDCKLKCLLCGGLDHHCCSQKCPWQGPGPSGINKLPALTETDQSSGKAKGVAPQRQKQLSKGQRTKLPPRVPYTNHDVAMNVPAGACANDPEKSNILCNCCPLPSITKWVQ